MYLKFHDDYVDRIVEEEKRTTWRMGPHNNPSPGEQVNLLSDDKGIFGYAEVVWVKQVKISDLSEEDKKWHESYDDIDDIINTLQEFYPNTKIAPSSTVNVIRFNLLDVTMEEEVNDS